VTLRTSTTKRALTRGEVLAGRDAVVDLRRPLPVVRSASTAPASAPSSSSWLEHASCRGRPTAWWFSSDQFDQAVAVSVCRSCPVRCECLAEAMELERGEIGGRHGVRGGLTARQRDASSRRKVVA
jgi:Transcription factor WhiB